MYSNIQRRKKPHFHTQDKLGKEIGTWPLGWTGQLQYCHFYGPIWRFTTVTFIAVTPNLSQWRADTVQALCSALWHLCIPPRKGQASRNPISSLICRDWPCLRHVSFPPGELTPGQSQSGSWKFSGHHHKFLNWRISSREPWNKMSTSHRITRLGVQWFFL